MVICYLAVDNPHTWQRYDGWIVSLVSLFSWGKKIGGSPNNLDDLEDICDVVPQKFEAYLFLKIFIYLLLLFRVTPMAYGDSQARGPVGAVAPSLRHSHTRSKPCLWPIPQFTATTDPWSAEQGQGSNCSLMVPSQICFCCATMGTPFILFFVF